MTVEGKETLEDILPDEKLLSFSREVKYNGDVRYWGMLSLPDIASLVAGISMNPVVAKLVQGADIS
jgi:hypothetical protein